MTDLIASERLELVWLSPELIGALLDGRRDELPFAVPDDWPDDHDRRFLAFRLRGDRINGLRLSLALAAVALVVGLIWQ